MKLGDDWNFYSYSYGEKPSRTALVRFDVERAIMPCPDTHQTCRRLLVREAGLPALATFESALPELLEGIDCMLVGVLRYPSTEELIFQIEDALGFTQRHDVLRAQAPAPIEFQDSAGWDFFVDRVTPNEADWQRITDRESIERHLRAGADPATPHTLLHTFIGDKVGIAAIRAVLEPEGFTVATLDSQRLVMQHAVMLTVADVSRVTVALHRFSRSHRAIYDGWKRQ